MITGASGAGKSSVARWLGERLELDVCTLGVIVWDAHGRRVPPEQCSRELERRLRHDAWILEGIDAGAVALIGRGLAACDAAIFLDMPRAVCLWRALKRAWAIGRSRPLGVHLRLVRWILWDYPSRVRPRLLALLRAQAPHKPVVVLRSHRELQRFLASIAACPPAGGDR